MGNAQGKGNIAGASLHGDASLRNFDAPKQRATELPSFECVISEGQESFCQEKQMHLAEARRFAPHHQIGPASNQKRMEIGALYVTLRLVFSQGRAPTELGPCNEADAAGGSRGDLDGAPSRGQSRRTLRSRERVEGRGEQGLFGTRLEEGSRDRLGERSEGDSPLVDGDFRRWSRLEDGEQDVVGVRFEAQLPDLLIRVEIDRSALARTRDQRADRVSKLRQHREGMCLTDAGRDVDAVDHHVEQPR